MNIVNRDPPYKQNMKKNLKLLALSTVLKTNIVMPVKLILSEFPNLRKEDMKAWGFSTNVIRPRESVSLGWCVSFL